jgi:hypothetical protein
VLVLGAGSLSQRVLGWFLHWMNVGYFFCFTQFWHVVSSTFQLMHPKHKMATLNGVLLNGWSDPLFKKYIF